METPETVAVVGGGAVGVTAAFDLATRGADVTLYERDEIAAESTGRAAGLLYDAYAEDVDARIAERAMERFDALAAAETDDRVGLLLEIGALCNDATADDGDPTERALVAAAADHGLDVDALSPGELGREYPALRVDDIEAAAVARNAAVADTAAYARGMAEKACEAGADVRTNTEATLSRDPLRVNGVAYDAVVVAAGAHTKPVLADVGVDVPLKPYRVQALTASGPDVPLFWDGTRDYYARPHPTGLLAGDGTQRREFDPDTYDRSADDAFVDDTVDKLRYRVPDADLSVDRAWAGLCVATPDKNPLLGELEDGIFVAAGWQGHGFMRSPATGEAVAELVLGDREKIGPYDPTRFDGTEEFAVRAGSDPN